MIGIEDGLGREQFLKNPNRYHIDTEMYPRTNFNSANLLIEIHHSIGKIEWRPDDFKLISALELFKDVIKEDGMVNHEIIRERFKLLNPLNATVMEFYIKNSSNFEKEYRWNNLGENFKLGKSGIAYAGTIYLDNNSFIFMKPGFKGNGIFPETNFGVPINNKKALENIYCPIIETKTLEWNRTRVNASICLQELKS
jgi:hypothetical protein